MGKIICVIIGTLIGAGFASGQEINIFFYSYGKQGMIQKGGDYYEYDRNIGGDTDGGSGGTVCGPLPRRRGHQV